MRVPTAPELSWVTSRNWLIAKTPIEPLAEIGAAASRRGGQIAIQVTC